MCIIIQDPVCGSAHCALAVYWSKKLGKCDLHAYAVYTPAPPPILVDLLVDLPLALFFSFPFLFWLQASPRSGTLKLQLDEQNDRVKLLGKAVTVMEGSILV